MSVADRHELPPDKEKTHQRAVRLERITLAYLVSAVFFIYLTLGASQAMKAAWLEDLMSLIPPLVFLVAARIRRRTPNEKFPYGYHRVVSIAFLCSSLALFLMGVFLLYDSISKLIAFEHPSIGIVQPWGEPVWLGWFMFPALVWSAIPAAILGRMKLPLARDLHDKVLFADADMNKADWLTAGAAMVGVAGIGLGIWWTDAAAAGFISLSILKDGATNLKTVTTDLMDHRPRTVDHVQDDPLPARVETEIRNLDWVEDARVRMREEGHVFFAEVFVVLRDQRNVVDRIGEAARRAKAIDWRLHDVVVSPVHDLTDVVAPDPARR